MKQALKWEKYMNTLVRCTACGQLVRLEKCYPSKTVIKVNGIICAVCPECHRKELEEEEKANEKEKDD